MSYKFIRELPQFIQDRIYLEEHTVFFDKLFSSGILPQDRSGDVYGILDAILLRKENLSDLPKLLVSHIGMTPEGAKRASIELWRGYFIYFQDYLGKIDVPFSQNPLTEDEEKSVRSLFGVHRQLQDVIAPILYELDLSECNPQCKDELKDILIAIATKSAPDGELKTKIGDILLKYNHNDIPVEKVFVRFVECTKNECTAEIADYYSSLPDLILAGKQHPLLRRQIAQSERDGDTQLIEEKQEESLQDRMQKASQEIRDAVLSSRAQEQRTVISVKYGLELEDLLYRIALKEVSFDHITFELRKQRALKPELVTQIRDEIIKTFFEPVMWYFTGEQKPETETTKSEPVVAGEKPAVMSGQPQPVQQKKPQESLAPKKSEEAPIPTREPSVQEPRHFETYEKLANLVIQKCITGMNEECRTRVQRALITRIRNIRTNIETAEKLIDAQHAGGCGITPEIAERAVKEAALLAQALQERKMFVGPQMPIEKIEIPIEMQIELERKATKQEEIIEVPQAPVVSPPELLPVSAPQISTLPVPLPEQKPVSLPIPPPSPPLPPPPPAPKPTPVAPPPQPKPPLVKSLTPPANLAIEEVDGIPTLVEKSAAPLPQPPLQPVQKQEAQTLKVEVRKTQSSSEENKKLSISDVKKAPHLVGPIEELQTFSLKDFRRISANPVQAANRIFDKIQSLEKESLPKKMEAIDAWKRSEVNQLYIEIGKESFGKGVPIAQAIEQRKNAGKEVLSEQEFDALLDLSTMLRS